MLNNNKPTSKDDVIVNNGDSVDVTGNTPKMPLVEALRSFYSQAKEYYDAPISGGPLRYNING